ncbi:MAG: SGNH/GDSL hydrolase family protein [Chitinophagaceae bacterium]
MKNTFLLILLIFASNTTYMQTKPLRYLALGDSYTIGESVATEENFPNQTIALLNQQGALFSSPTIVAKTGWTTDELEAEINKRDLSAPYDLVTLLIGVNNQYRGRGVDEYEIEFTRLLKTAIGFAGNQVNKVVVLSIPDWGVTPFAEDRDRKKIAEEIDGFNDVNRKIADAFKVHYIDITPFTREAALDKTLVATDELHPSANDYGRWARLLAEKVTAVLKNEFQIPFK